MNKRTIIASINNIANELDNLGRYDKANKLTKIMVKIAQEDPGQEDPGQDEPIKSSNPEVQKKLKELDTNTQQKIIENEKKIESSNSLEQLYNLREEFINNPPFDEITLQYYITDIDEKIALLERKDLLRFQQLISKPYFESNIKNFLAIGNQIENDESFRSLYEKTKQKIRSYYGNLKEKIQTRSTDRGNIPLLNSDTMKNKPDQLSSFVVKNLQYETNKIINPKSLGPLMQKYLEYSSEASNAAEVERETKLQFVKDTYKNVDSFDAFNLAMQLMDPKNINMRAHFQYYLQTNIVEELIDEYEELRNLCSTILENAKKYAQTGSEASFAKAYKSTVPFTEFPPLRTIYNLREYILENRNSLSKSLSDATKLYTAANDAYQKVQSVLKQSLQGKETNSWFKFPNYPEEIEESRNLYKPLYPGSTPPE
jgi:hypothetical protein